MKKSVDFFRSEFNKPWRKKIANIPNVNNEINADPIRLVDENGEMVGVVPLSQGLSKAQQASLDLVEVSPMASPPVCKILDYGKLRFEAQKKKKEAKKKQKITHLKEIKLRVNVGEHDYQVKLRHILKFLEADDKVKVSLRFRGREITHDDLGKDLLKRVASDVGENGKIEQEAKMEGRQMVMILAPA